MFVCTGTEANNLAYNIARTVTGRTGAVITDGSYHGNSIEIGALWRQGMEIQDDPDHVAAIEAPDAYRGPFGKDDPELGRKLTARAAPAIEELARSRHGLAMLMIDAIFDAPGIFTAPPGYLSELFNQVRAEGGLVVVDEVQSGLCRLGDKTIGVLRIRASCRIL